MDKGTATSIAAVLGALGLILILAGPAFHFIDSSLGIFAALVYWIIAGVVRGFAKDKGEGAKRRSGLRLDSPTFQGVLAYNG